jgi:hypothetical protein
VITGATKWNQVAVLVRDAAYAGLTTKPQRWSVVPGAIAWDECDCGLLAVSLNQVFPSDAFPQPYTDRTNPCGAAWQVGEFVVQVVRCAPSPDSQSLAPTTAELEASALLVQTDVSELLTAVQSLLCGLYDDGSIVDFLISPLTAQGPHGGCVGNELRFLVGLGAA